jgi:DNA-binding CsgD family transcriptional regulator
MGGAHDAELRGAFRTEQLCIDLVECAVRDATVMSFMPFCSATAMSGFVRAERARGLLRLLGELYEVGPEPDARRRHATAGLCRLLGAQVAAMVVVDDHRPGGVGVLRSAVDHGFSTARDRDTAFAPLVAGGVIVDPALARLIDEPGPVVTRRREDVVSDREWYRSPLVMESRRVAGIDHVIYSWRTTEQPGVVHGICINRPWGERPFTEEDRDLLDVFQAECGALLRAARPPLPEEALDLTRRERQTLEAMLSGASEKEIAAGLGLSHHTVHQYVKRIYLALGVRSRAELLARCLPLSKPSSGSR